MGEGMADDGAQFFTVQEVAFRQAADGWLASGLAYLLESFCVIFGSFRLVQGQGYVAQLTQDQRRGEVEVDPTRYLQRLVQEFLRGLTP